MNETFAAGDFAEALVRTAPKDNENCIKIADYALTILGLSVSSMHDEAIHDNVNCINLFARGFVKFCGSAIGISEADCADAFGRFLAKALSLDPPDAALHVNYLNEAAKTPEGIALIKAGELAAYECQQGNVPGAVAALRKALGV